MHKLCWVSNSIPDVESLNFDTSWPQKLIWAKFLEFEIFLSEKTKVKDITRKKACLDFIIIHKSDKEIVDKKAGEKNESLHFLGNPISLLMQVDAG